MNLTANIDKAERIGRFTPPPLHVAAVNRMALVQRLCEKAQAPVQLVIAPAGFGKSTLLAQFWSMQRQKPDTIAVWLSLDETDEHPIQFVAHLFGALEAARGGVGQENAALHSKSDPWDIDASVSLLIDHLQLNRQRVFIILDDYHLVQSADVDRIVNMLIRHSGSNLVITIGSRERPSLALAALEARGMTSTLESTDLKFAPEELSELFGKELNNEGLQIISEQTEGWPVAVQYARIWLSKDPARHKLLHSFTGRTTEITRYFAEQVFGDLDGDLQDFLIETAVLDQFDGALADAMRDRVDSHALLSKLQSLYAFIVPLDEEQIWFRCHRLLRDFLLQKLSIRGADGIGALNRRAAHAWAERGMTFEAVRQAQWGNDVMLAVQLCLTLGWRDVMRKGIGFTQNLLGLFSPATIATEQKLLLMRALTMLRQMHVDQCRRDLERAERLNDAGAPLSEDLLIVRHMHRLYTDQIYGPEWRQQLSNDMASLAIDNHPARTALGWIAAVADLSTGNVANAEMEARRALDECAMRHSVLGKSNCTIYLAQSLFVRGRTDEAEKLFREVLPDAEAWSEIDSPLKGAACCLLATLLYWQNNLAEARALSSATSHIMFSAGVTAYALAETARTVASLDYLISGPAAALTTIDEVRKVGEQRGIAMLVDLSHALRLETLIVAGMVEEARELVETQHLEKRIRDFSGTNRWREQTAYGLALGRWLIIEGRSANALALLRPLREFCVSQARYLDAARLDFVIAMALRQRGAEADAEKSIASGLKIVAVAGAPRLLLDCDLSIVPVANALLQRGAIAMSADQRDKIAKLLLERRNAHTPEDGLTSREMAVLQQLCLGRSNKQISWYLGITQNTVKFHLKRVFAKLGVATRSAAVSVATARGLVANNLRS